MRPHRWQPTRLPRPWDSPGKNTGVGCHFLLHCMKVKSENEVAQSCLTLRNPMDYSPPGSSIHGIFHGVGCHCLLQCMKVKSQSEVAQSCPTPSDPMDCSLPGSSVHGIFQARVLEWGAIAFSSTFSFSFFLPRLKKRCFVYNSWWMWRRQWHPTPILLPGKSHGRRSLVGCSPWGR